MARIQTMHKRTGDLMTARMYNEIIDSVNALYDRQESFKGAYASPDDLGRVKGSDGDLALVLDDGAFPAAIYRHNGTAWSPTGKTWSPTESIDLAAYAKSIDLAFLVCGTAAATAAKVVTAAGYALKNGGNIRIKMTYANTADNATLNINSTGNVPLFYDGERSSSANTWEAGETIIVYYDAAAERYMACNAEGGGKMKYMTLDELNTQTNKIYSEGKVVLVSTGEEGVDAYFVGNGKNYLTNTSMKYLGRGIKETVLGTFKSGGVGNKVKGTYISNSTGVVVNGTQNGSDVRVRVFDVSDKDGQFLRLEYNSLGTGSKVINGGWSFFMKTYEEGEEGMDAVPTPYADYDFQNGGHVLAHGWMDAAESGLKHAYVRVPANARFLCLTYYNNASATSGQRCGHTLIEPVEYASKEENEELDTRVTQLTEDVEQADAAVKSLTEELDYLADDLVSVGRTAKKYIIAETGALYSGYYGAAGRFYVSNYIDVSAIRMLSYYIKFYCKQNAAVIAAYDEEKNYILENSVTLELKSSAKAASGTWTKGEGTRYIRIGIDQYYPSHFVTVGGNIPDLLKRVKALEDAEGETPDVVRNNPDMTHLLPQMRFRGDPAASQGGQNDSSTTVLVHFSDIHGQKGNMKNIVAFRDYYGRYIDDVLNTGDTVQNSFSNDTAQKQAGSEDFLTAIGNHDTTTGSYNWYYYVGLQAYEKFIKPYMFETIVDDETGTSETVNRWGVVQPEDADTEGYCWYYKDYASGVRLIVLDYMNAIEVQTQWLTGVLADAREKGKTVVIASHIVPGKWNALPCGMTQSQDTSSSSTYGGSAQFVRNVNAVHDFMEGGGKFVCWLAGHTHVDFVGVGIGTGTVTIDGETVAVNNTGQILVRVAMAAYNNTQTRVSREAGSASYDDFNIVCIDPSNKWLQLAKVGSQYNRALMRRSPVCIDYESGTIVWGEYKSNN